jgi:hypothetical protein
MRPARSLSADEGSALTGAESGAAPRRVPSRARLVLGRRRLGLMVIAALLGCLALWTVWGDVRPGHGGAAHLATVLLGGGGGLANLRAAVKADPALGHDKDCESPSFVGETLKLVREKHLMELMIKYTRSDNTSRVADQLDRFEASDIVGSPDGAHYYVVFDNSFKIGRLDNTYVHTPKSVAEQNDLLEWDAPTSQLDASQFEAIAYNASSDTYLVFAETHQHVAGAAESETGAALGGGSRLAGGAGVAALEALVHEIRLGVSSTQHVRHCTVEFAFNSENKGVEGAAVLAAHGRSYLLALCEGNGCEGGAEGRAVGHGTILVLERRLVAGDCAYVLRQRLALPPAARFRDYSSMSIIGNRIAVASQENSAVWIGTIEPADDPRSTAVFVLGGGKAGSGKVYDFPRNDACQIKYCNIEGIFFESPNVLITVSDAMKKGGGQSFRCHDKGQTVGVFQLP